MLSPIHRLHLRRANCVKRGLLELREVALPIGNGIRNRRFHCCAIRARRSFSSDSLLRAPEDKSEEAHDPYRYGEKTCQLVLRGALER